MVASSIAQQLVSLQQQVLQRMGALTGQSIVAGGAVERLSVAKTVQGEEAVRGERIRVTSLGFVVWSARNGARIVSYCTLMRVLKRRLEHLWMCLQ